MVVVVLVPLAWLLGTFPSAVVVARARGVDVLAGGSGNPGASNVARLLGWRYGAVVLALDFGKGVLASGVGLAVGGRPGAYALGAAAVLGHTLPLYRKGGKGVATAAGMLAVLFPWIALGATVVWFFVAQVLKKASIASLLVTILFPVAAALTGHAAWEVAVLAALAALVVARHAPNIRRLLRREEIDLRSGTSRTTKNPGAI